jgi:hypothetical protein
MFASARLLGNDEKAELSVPASWAVHALLDAEGSTVAYIREGSVTGQPGYGDLWAANDPGMPARLGPLRIYTTRAVGLYTLPMLAFRDSSD